MIDAMGCALHAGGAARRLNCHGDSVRIAWIGLIGLGTIVADPSGKCAPVQVVRTAPQPTESHEPFMARVHDAKPATDERPTWRPCATGVGVGRAL
jgi:hypothetical protein